MKFNMHCTEADENKTYYLNFFKDSKLPSDIHLYKLLPLIEIAIHLSSQPI